MCMWEEVAKSGLVDSTCVQGVGDLGRSIYNIFRKISPLISMIQYMYY